MEPDKSEARIDSLLDHPNDRVTLAHFEVLPVEGEHLGAAAPVEPVIAVEPVVNALVAGEPVEAAAEHAEALR